MDIEAIDFGLYIPHHVQVPYWNFGLLLLSCHHGCIYAN